MSAASNPAKDRNGPGSIVCSFGLGGFGWPASKVKRVESAIAEVLKTKAKGVAALIAMGKALTEIKSQCEHGQFEAIVKLRVGISPRNARYAMEAYSALGKRNTCSDLDKFDTCAVRMLSAKSTPPAVIERAISSAREGDHVTVYMVKNLLAESGEAKPKAKTLAKTTPKATAAIKGPDVADARSSVPESKRAQYDRALGKAQAALKVQMEQELARQVEARVAPAMAEREKMAHDKFRESMDALREWTAKSNGIKQALTREEWKLVLGILHPDRAPEGQHGKYAESFRIVMKLKPYIEAFA